MNDEFTPKNKTEEDWSMSDPNKELPPNQTIIQPIENWAMTEKLVPPKQGLPPNWQMPEPKFQATSGALPKDFVKKTPDYSDLETQPLSLDEIPNHSIFTEVIEEVTGEVKQPPQDFLPSPENAATAFEQPAAILPIEPQPDLAEVFATAEIKVETLPEEKPRSKAVQLVLAVLGLAAMFVFAVLFLIIVYVLFFRNTIAE